MPEEHHLTARNLLEQMNRQFNECNALYHELAVHYGVSNTVFWLLYTLYNSSEPQTQNRLCMEWNLPKQTMNSAVASMVKQGLLELEPAPGRYSGKLLHLTPAGRGNWQPKLPNPCTAQNRRHWNSWAWRRLNISSALARNT